VYGIVRSGLHAPIEILLFVLFYLNAIRLALGYLGFQFLARFRLTLIGVHKILLGLVPPGELGRDSGGRRS
jgi:hypothetical protein